MARKNYLRIAGVFCVFVVVLCLQAHAIMPDRSGGPRYRPGYGGGTGEPNDPYLIYTAEQLTEIGYWGDLSCHYKLMADIDLADYTGSKFNIIGSSSSSPFTGTFDGNDHTISNFLLHPVATESFGMFGCVSDPNAEIKNVHMLAPEVYAQSSGNVAILVGSLNSGVIRDCVVDGGYVVGDDNVGGLVGWCRGTIINCQVSCTTVGGNSIGGLVGFNEEGLLSNCLGMGDVSSSDDYVGGLVGYNHRGTLEGCSTAGHIHGNDYVGGLAGFDYQGTLNDCFAVSRVGGHEIVGGLVGCSNQSSFDNCSTAGDTDGDNNVGGLMGYSSGNTLDNCSATGHVNGNDEIGGLVGYGDESIISNCWTTGDVNGIDNVGGLIGRFSGNGTITASYSTATVTGNDCVGGFVGISTGAIAYSYAIGQVSGRIRVGGLVGSVPVEGRGVGSFLERFVQCYWIGSVSGQSYTGGLIGSCMIETMTACFWDMEISDQTTSDGGQGKTTAQMQDMDTYLNAGWDFVGETANGTEDIWWIEEGVDYPRLWWEARE